MKILCSTENKPIMPRQATFSLSSRYSDGRDIPYTWLPNKKIKA